MDINWDLLLEHWPAGVVAMVLAVLGRLADRIFTREAAYVFNAKGEKIAKRRWMYAMRESLPVHPILIGFALGCFMPPYEPHVTTRPMIILYYTGAGIAGLVIWIWHRANAKAYALPGGGSVHPPSGAAGEE